MATVVLKIDEDFKNLIRPLSQDEYLQLEANLLLDGCREPITTWNGIIVDGHNRYEICKKHNIPFNVQPKEFDCREEVIIWSTEEFKYIELSEKWSTGSSIMPQKKNPDFAELIRGRAGLVYGNLMALLTMMKGLPLSYNRDMQEDKNSLFSAYDTALSCVIVFTEMIGSARWNTDRMALSCSGGYANATDVADYLVRKGISFRTAHGVAAAIVRKCIEKGYPDIEKMPLAELRDCSPLIEADLLESLTPSACVENRNHPGGPAYDRTLIQINELKAFCGAARKCIEKYL